MRTKHFIFILTLPVVISSAQAADDLQTFPPTAQGVVRHVLQFAREGGEVRYRTGRAGSDPETVPEGQFASR